MRLIWDLAVYVIVDRCSPSRRYTRWGRRGIKAMRREMEKAGAK